MAAPELRLEVSLNLLGFRSEIQKLTNIAQNEFTPKINVKFNRQTLDLELNNLQRAIKRRVYHVEIGGNIDSLPDKIKALKEQLASLESFKVDLGIGAVKSLSKRDAAKIVTDLRGEILGERKKIYVPVSIKSGVTRQDVRDFQNAVKSKLSGFTVKVKADLETTSVGGGSRGATKGAASRMTGEQALEGKGRGELQKIYGLFREANLRVGELSKGLKKSSAEEIKEALIPAFTDSGKEAVNGLAIGLKDPSSKVSKAAERLAKETIQDTKKAFGIASPSREFKKIGEAAGQGFEQGLLSSMADAFDSLERQLGTKLQRLKAQAIAGTSGALAVSGRVSPVQVADVTPRDYARIAGSGPRAALPPGVDRSAATTQEFFAAMDRIGLAMANFTDTIEATTATMQGLKKVIAALNNRALLSNHEQYRLFAQSLTKGQLPLLSGTASQQFPMLKAAGASPRADALRPQDRLLQDFLARTTKLLLPQGPGASGGRSVFTGKQFREIAGNLRRPQIGPGTDLTVKSIAIKDVTGISESFKQLRTPLLPPVGGTTASARMRQQLSALPPLTAPSIGRENAPLSRAATYSLNKANQLLGLPMAPSSPLGSMGQFPMSGMMGRGSLGQFPVDPMLAVGGASAMGQKVAGPYPWSNTARSARGGYIGGIASSLQFPMSGMMGPSSPLGRITPQSSMFAGGGGGGPGGGGPGGGGGDSFGGMRFNVPQLPGSGVVREIGTEFAFAAKQVLLFGTAYKALAFLQGFPSQVGNAVGVLQSFRNTLGAISPSATEAAASSQFILDVVDKYNTPIQSARDGFTKLYASMKPTGFSGDEIRDLFLGISQAAATFGMSSDKVDRVNYAFAQMASKGQVMSEELKGQLGDVLPGAMGIFAEAAGFTGPEAITKFSKALEDGAYKGAAMKTLLTNVGLIMRKEFGPGAEGAARTFQGVINRMQNSLTLLYESFEPVAVGFLNAVVMPMTKGVKTVTDGFKAFFTGQAAQTAGGSVFAKQLEALRPAFEGIAANIKQILPLLQSFASTALSLGQALLQIAGNPFVGYLARIYLSVLPLTMALRVLNLQVLIPLIGSFLRAIPAFIAFNAAMMSGVGTNRALIATMQLTGQAAGVTAGKIRLVNAALATLGRTAILAGIGYLVERFLMMKGAIDGVRQSTQQMLGSISGMANSGAVRELKNVGQDLQKQRGTFEELRSFVSGGAIAGGKERLTEAGAKKFEEVGMGSFVGRDVFGKPYIADFLRASEIIEEKLKGLDKQSSKVQEKLPLAAKVAADLAKQAQAAQVIAPIPEAPGDGTGKPPKEQSLESYYGLQDTLAKNAADFAAAQTEEEFRHKIELLEMYYDIQETRANAYQKDAIKFEREMVMIEARRQESRLKAQLDVQRAQASVAGGAGGGGAGSGGKGLGAGIAQYITGDPSSPFYRADHGGGNYHEHLAFVSREAAEEAYKKLTSAGIQVTEFKGKSRVGRHTPGSAHYEGLAFDVPGAQVPVGRERELTARVQSTLGIGGARPAPVPASRKRDAVAEQNTIQASIAKTAKERMADAKAVQEQIVALEKYRTTAFPTIEQETQNKLLAKRNELFRSGMTDEQIDREIKLYENQERGTAALAAVQRLYDGNIIKLDKYNELMAIFNRDIATQNTLLQENANALAQAKFDQTIKGIRDQLAMATPVGGTGLAAGFMGDAGAKYEEAIKEGRSQDEAARFAELQNQLTLLETRNGAVKSSVLAIGDAFATAMTTGVAGLISGTATAQEVFASFLKSIGDALLQAAQQMIATYIAIGIAKIFAGLGGGGNFTGGTSSAVPTDAAGWGSSFQTSLPGLSGDIGRTPIGFANGGIATGGFTAFANGGMVTGPTMGLVGEGKYNEAIVPLPDGKSIPVQMTGSSGGGSLRDAMNSNSVTNSSPVLNMSFQSTSINGVEYVSRDQLESAMAETRRNATRDGAKRGMTMTLDRIQNSSYTRRKVGI